MEIVQILHQEDVRRAGGGDQADFALDAKMLGGVDRRHLESRHRGKALGNGVTEDPVNVTFAHQGGGVTVVGAQDEVT